MNSKRLISVVRWLGVAICLAGIVAFYRLVVHANPTTVALTLLLLILFLAAKLGLRFAIVTSIAATVCYNFFFLPPIGTFTVSDPQNLLALVVFLITSVFASRLSDRIRSESKQARYRETELEVLYSLSRGLLQTDEVAQLTNTIPAAIMAATGSKSVLFFLLEGDKIYLAGLDRPPSTDVLELRDLANLPGVSLTPSGEGIVPLRTGVRPRGLLILGGVTHSIQTLEAIGGLVSVSLDRARAVEVVAHTEATKESERFRSLILDSITHELRTPVASIEASVTELLASNMQGDASRKLLTLIGAESDRLNRLIADAIEVAQLDAQQTSISMSPQKIEGMIDAAIAATVAKLSGHEITVRIAPSLPMVIVDPHRIQKVIGNLLENAASYSAIGQPIFVSAELRGRFIECSVADRGIGIDPSEQSLIFDTLYRSRSGLSHITGTGMGLAICRAIIEAHGGVISVTSQINQGSVFTFTLPIQ